MTNELSQIQKTNTTRQPRPRRERPLKADLSGRLSTPETIQKRSKTSKFLAKLGLAALCIIPTADLALSDAITVKAYDAIQDKIEISAPPLEKAAETTAIAGFIMAESLALGQIISKNKKARNAFGDFNEYMDYKHSHMGKIRRGVSKTVNAPFTAVEKIGLGFESLGEKVSARKTKAARDIGQLIIDTGRVNAMGTSNIIMQETMADKPPSLARQAYWGGLIAGSWVGGAEAVRGIYRSVAAVRPPMAAIGRTYEALTTISLSNPAETPIGSLAIGSTVAALAYTGWKIQEFRQHREEATSIDPAQLNHAITEFQHASSANP